MTRTSWWGCLTATVLIATAPVAAQDYADPVERALAEFDWESTAGDGIVAYYKAGSFAERHRHMLLRSARVALDEAMEFLGREEYERELRIFYVESRAEMKELVGTPVTGLAVWTSSGVFLVVNAEWRSFEKHEITHVLTMGEWGQPHESSRWMVEGISVACDGWCRTNTVDEIAFYLLSRGELPPVGEMFADVRALGEIRGGVYAASIIDFLRAKYGIDAVRDLWIKGTAELPDLVGATVDEIESAWREHLKRAVGDDVEVDYDAIEAKGCG